jgi:GT2 family glycosyltransferase
MDVSVIILNYNTFELTCDCIKSVFEKTSQCSFEIIVVDNASTDRDPKDFIKLFPTIKLVVNEENTGFAKGNNAGIAVASGEYVLLLNSDTELLNNAILYCLQSIKKHPSLSAVTCRLLYPDGTVQHNCQRFPSVGHRLFELLRLQKVLPRKVAGRILLGYFFDYRSWTYPDWIWGTFFMFRRSLLGVLQNGKLAEDFFMYVEDMQWCKEFRKLGYDVAFEPRGEVVHYMGKSKANRDALMEVNVKKFLKRYHSPLEIFMLATLDRWLVNRSQ